MRSLRLTRLALLLAWRASPLALGGIGLLLMVEAALQPLQLALWRAVIDRTALELGLDRTAGGPIDPNIAATPHFVWIALAAAALLARQLIQPAATTLQSLAGDRLTGHVSQQLIAAANHWRGLARFEDPWLADDLERARTRAGAGTIQLVVYGGRAATMMLTAATLALLLARLHPLVPVVLFAAGLPQMAKQWEYQDRTRGHLHTQTPDSRRLNYLRGLTYMPANAKDVRLYALVPFLRERYDVLFERAARQLGRIRLTLASQVALASALATVAGGAVYAYVVWEIARGERTLGDLALYGGAAVMFQDQLLGIGYHIGFLPTPLGFLPSLFRILEAPPDLAIPDAPHRAPQRLQRGIAFRDVSFTYPGQSRPTLRELTCEIAPGECVALVGHNGAGKTTLVKLLLRLYDPTSGRIEVDDLDLRLLDLDALRRRTAVVFQDFMRYDLTAGENIALGDLSALTDPERLLAAADRAGAGPLIRSFPQGLDTPLGRELGGRDLSGGEWQKLALARAFVRDDAQLLILDEPTAALDVQSEHDVYQRFRELTYEKTTLLISHRFSSVRMADRILLLEEGRITEDGTHEALLRLGGEYARLFHLQSSHYAAVSSPAVAR